MYADGAPVRIRLRLSLLRHLWFGPGLVDQVAEAARPARLMGLCELAVRPPWQSCGIGSRLHDALVTAIAPRWSSLLALPSNQRGQDLFARLSYQYAGPYLKTADEPAFDLPLLKVAPGDALRPRHLR